MLGESGLQEYTYKNIAEKKAVNFDVTNGWLGITDKYWAAVLVPDTTARLKARPDTKPSCPCARRFPSSHRRGNTFF